MGLTYYLPNISGVTQYAVILAQELVKRNYKVSIITSRHLPNLPKEETIEGVRVKRLGGIPLGKGFIMPGYIFESWRMIKQAEVVMIHLPSIEGLLLALGGKLMSKRIVVIHHCEFGFSGPLTNRMVAFLSYPIHFLTYLLADIVTAYTKDYAENSMFLKKLNKIKFVLPPVVVEKASTKLDIKGEKIIGFVGRIAWEKGISHLIDAFLELRKEIAGLKLVLVGPYSQVAGDRYYTRIKPWLEKYKNEVIMYGPLAHRELKAFYDICDVLVLPSTDNLETFGIVQAEAMKCGVPVVASNLPGVRVPVSMTGMGEIAKIGDSKDLAEKIMIVLTKGKNHYQKLSKNLEKFDYKKTVDEYEKLLLP